MDYYRHGKVAFNRLRMALPGLAATVLVFALADALQAVDRFWGNPLGGTFSTPGNWQGGSVAGVNDDAHFGLTTDPLNPVNYTVDFNEDFTTTRRLLVEDDVVTFDLNGHSYANQFSTAAEIGNVGGREGL